MILNPLAEGRSPHWAAVRRAHLALEPECQACGGTADLQVHHVRPYHVHPELELEQSNLITLCEHPGRNCHYTFGHGFNWHGWLPGVREDAAAFRAKVKASNERARNHGASMHSLAAFCRSYCRRRKITTHTQGGYWPLDVCKAYALPTGLKNAVGRQLKIGIVTLGGGTQTSDIAAAFAQGGLAASLVPTFTAVSVDGGQNSPGDPADVENALDVQVAPVPVAYMLGESIEILEYFAPNSDSGIANAINAAVADNCDGVSISWGSGEPTWSVQSYTETQQAAANGRAKGVIITAAAGDNDSGDGLSGNNVDLPASLPDVIGVGGTTLITGPTGLSEKVWNDGSSGTGGGYSALFGRPSYQAGANSNPKRGVPDVAANADPATGWIIVVNGQVQVIGGTSAAAPFICGVLVAAKAAKLFSGDALSMIYANPRWWRDIVLGNNIGYDAGPGWDPCTGMGTPNGPGMTGGSAPPVNPPTPPTGPTLAQAQAAAVGAIDAYASRLFFFGNLIQGCEPGVVAALAKLWQTQGSSAMPTPIFGNGALLGLILQELPQLLPVILQLIGAGQGTKPAIRAAVVAHAGARFDLQTILNDLPQIEAAIEAILEAAQGLSGAGPAQENTAHYTTHSKGRFGMRVDATTIQTDLANLATAQQQTATAESGLNDANTALTTAQNGVTTAQTAVSAAQTAVSTAQQNQAALVKQAIADITAVYGAPAA